MRSIRGTVTEHPYQSLSPGAWIKSGEVGMFIIPTEDLEILHHASVLISDLFQAEDDHPVLIANSGASVIAVTNNYTQLAEKVDSALRRLSEHHGLPGVIWTHGHEYNAAVEVEA